MLVRNASIGAEEAGAEVTVIDLRDCPMPIYDGDVEASDGVPASVIALRELMFAHQGLLVASPEYNGLPAPLLKNAVDWTTRPASGKDGLAPYRNKLVVLMSASPGTYGGLRGLTHVRTLFSNIGAIVLPDQLALSKAHEVFATDGSIADRKQRDAVMALGRILTETLARLHGHVIVDEPKDRRHDLGRPMAPV